MSGGVLHDPILKAYRDLHAHAGVHGMSGGESLIRHDSRTERCRGSIASSMPATSCRRSRCSIGAHDADHLRVNMVLRPATGDEHFIPLRSTMRKPVKKGEYVCADAEKVICWLDIRQCAETRITTATKSCLIYIQGTKNTGEAYLDRYRNEIIIIRSGSAAPGSYKE